MPKAAPNFEAPSYKSLFEAESAILDYWQKEKIFEASLQKNEGLESYSFYDGPPFITGSPHYGTLLPSIVKDIIPRYQTMKGKYVRRVWGWDVHGLPAENQVEKQLGFSSKKDIEAYGIKKFIAACRQYVAETSDNWRWYIDHIGRWVDMDNAYRTDQPSYMESVIWVFKELYDKDLIYRGRRTSLYCPRCATPLSKFEITMDDENYRDVEDPAVTVAFKLLDEETYLLAWTTTPWTLPANLALAVDPEAEYVKVTDGKKTFVLAHLALERYRDFDLEIIETFKGQKLVGQKYQPLYQFTDTNPDKDFQVYAADFVTMDEGTGIVHVAPGFGEDDTKLGEAKGLSILLTVNDEGHMTEQVGDWRGLYYKKADPLITADLQRRGLLFKEEKITHSYPHCYRCGTPLIYKSQVSWYMRLSELKTQLLDQNKLINWVPKHFGDKRFAYNVENAPDWSISRTRYWGTPIPVWETTDGELVVVGSVAELEKLSGQKISDWHRPEIDEVELTLPDGRKAKRVKEVLDCWFESGAMPYAQLHYPFENKKEFEQNFPADFIVEYTGQLRGWFYYLHVLANALRGENAYKNVVVTGVLMGTDGRKMSKSFNNYPDPKATIEKYGAESLRLYFMGSKIMQGDDPSLSESEIREQSRLLQVLHNSCKYFLTYANVHGFKPTTKSPLPTLPNLIDRWINLRLEELIRDYSRGLDEYDFVAATKTIRPFIEDLSTWYIRRSRERFVGGDTIALETLHQVLLRFALAVAPTLPFSAELIYRGLGENGSVHLQDYPAADEAALGEHGNILGTMAEIRQIVSVAHKIRAENGVSLRQPLASLNLISYEQLHAEDEFLEILKDELNVDTVLFNDTKGKYHFVEDGKQKIGLDLKLTDALKEEGRFRELLRQLQAARKKAGLTVGGRVILEYATDDATLAKLLEKRRAELITQVAFSAIKPVEKTESLSEVPGEKLSIRFS